MGKESEKRIDTCIRVTDSLWCPLGIQIHTLLCVKWTTRRTYFITQGTLVSITWQPTWVAQTVKRLPAMQETRVQSLRSEDLLEKAMAPHSSTLACKIPWMVEPGRLQSMGSQRVGHDWATSLSLSLTWENILKDSRYTYMYNWITLLYACS